MGCTMFERFAPVNITGGNISAPVGVDPIRTWQARVTEERPSVKRPEEESVAGACVLQVRPAIFRTGATQGTDGKLEVRLGNVPHRRGKNRHSTSCERGSAAVGVCLVPSQDGTADAVRREVSNMRMLYSAIRRYFTELNRAQDVARGLASHDGEARGR